jgi:hypothetical protein
MKLTNFIFIILVLFLFVVQTQGQADNEILIPLRNITVFPAGIAQPGSGIEKINDDKSGVDNEIFHTLWEGIPKQNITIEADLDGKGKRLDKVILSPRAYGLNGIIKNAELWIMSKGIYQKVAAIEAELDNAPVQIELEHPVKDPSKVKLIITDSYGDRLGKVYMVSLGELECVMLSKDAVTKAQLLQDSKLFMGLTGVALKSDVKKKDIKKMKVPAVRKLATLLFEHRYLPDSLIAKCQPILDPQVLGKQMRIGDGYSKFEGITGIVLEKGDNIVFLGETKGSKIKLLIPDWTRKPPVNIKPENDPVGWGLSKEVFTLKEGINLIHVKKGGNVYIQYFTDTNPENYPPVTVHFPTGKYNGYFDITRGDTEADFNRLLTNAISPILDMRGNYIQVAFPVDSLKKYTLGKGVTLIKNYDTIVGLQRHLIGWEKEGFFPTNHILVRVN